jgi:hypothetical protein
LQQRVEGGDAAPAYQRQRAAAALRERAQQLEERRIDAHGIGLGCKFEQRPVQIEEERATLGPQPLRRPCNHRDRAPCVHRCFRRHVSECSKCGIRR